MSIHVHKTGLSKTLGQKSDTIVDPDNILGNFVPSVVSAGHWDNSATNYNQAIRRYNGITHNDSTPHNFEFDGTDDYLGEASTGYGGDAFEIITLNAFTLSQWAKTSDVDNSHCIFNIQDENGDEYIDFYLDTGKASVWIQSSANSVDSTFWYFGATSAETDSNATTVYSEDEWAYITFTHDDSGSYKCYKNGSYIATTSPLGEIGANWLSAYPLEIGRSDYENFYTGSGWKIGHVHVYGYELTNSQIRQNFLATHKMHSDRIYGDTFEA